MIRHAHSTATIEVRSVYQPLDASLKLAYPDQLRRHMTTPFRNSARFLLLLIVVFSFALSSTCIGPEGRRTQVTTVPLYSREPRHRKDYEYSNNRRVHNALRHQQHVNRGLRRLARMTNCTAPSQDDLLANLYLRIESVVAEAEESARIGPSRNRTRARPRPVNRLPHVATAPLEAEAWDVGYLTKLSIGTPPKEFNVLVDSGSGDFWVTAEGCRANDGGPCANHTAVGSEDSATFILTDERWSIRYVTGSVSGYIANDTVLFGGIPLENHRFGAAFNESIEFTGPDAQMDGILGFALQFSSRQGIPTFLNSLFRAKLIPAPIASFKLPRWANDSSRGELTLGGLDPAAYIPSTLVTVKNMNKFGFYEVKLDGFSVGDLDMVTKNRSMIVDTGTALLVVPPADYEAIHKAIPGATFTGGEWTVPCLLTKGITLTISGNRFSVDPRDLAFAPINDSDPDGACMSGIGVFDAPFGKDNVWLAGAVVLKNFYLSTDESKDEISIAKLQSP